MLWEGSNIITLSFAQQTPVFRDTKLLLLLPNEVCFYSWKTRWSEKPFTKLRCFMWSMAQCNVSQKAFVHKNVKMTINKKILYIGICPHKSKLCSAGRFYLFYLVEATENQQRKCISSAKYPKVDASIWSIPPKQILELPSPTAIVSASQNRLITAAAAVTWEFCQSASMTFWA